MAPEDSPRRPVPPCPLCDPAPGRIVASDAQVLLLREGGGLVLAPRRHVGRWRDLTEAERAALGARLAPAQALLETGTAPAPVSLIETGAHLQLRIDAPTTPGGPLPGAPHDRPLIAGGADALHAHLRPLIDRASAVDLAVSFLMTSGARLILPHLRDLLARGGRLRLLTGDYLDVTEPAALRLLQDLEHDCGLYVFQAGQIPFHPKAWMFSFADGAGALIVGSSNLSRSALTHGVEWNLRHFDRAGALPLTTARQAFEALLARPEVTALSADWIDGYEARRVAPAALRAGQPAEAPEAPPTPHAVQREALAALEASRGTGYRAGLVVLATGLGKTFLAAFDSRSATRVLFVAHREEILTQAMQAFRAVRPKARLGRFDGGEKAVEAEVLFASIQTLARAPNLQRFAPEAFDYIVVDEFHHAAAATYRRIIDHFTPRFLLGLTATPDRSDGGDLLGLCEENLVYDCDLWSGIDRGLLSAFRYYGVPDPVEYAQIPWRSGRFDEAALTEALATQARAENALDQLARRGGRRAIGFCVSRRHADFMAAASQRRGLRAVAVHSGETSAPRASALRALEEGALDIIYAVDMFNEGVDVPAIDTVLMLRPTESPVIWLQQLGRGLRLSAEKSHLAVIDYIGNHRVFLTKARSLLRVGAGEAALRMALESFERGEIAFPEGCEVTYDLAALDILKALIRRPRDGEELAAFYRDFRERHGVRPSASEMQHAGFNPGRAGPAGWLGFVESMGDLSGPERAAWQGQKALLDEIETTRMTRSYKMLVLRGMIEAGAFPGRIALATLAERVGRLAARNPAVRAEISVAPEDGRAVTAMLKKYPLKLWAETRWFQIGPGSFQTRLDGEAGLAAEERAALAALASELVDWRLLRHFQTRRVTYDPQAPTRPAIAAEAPGAAPLRPEAAPRLWAEYPRAEIPPLFGADFDPERWGAQSVLLRGVRAMVLLVSGAAEPGAAAGLVSPERLLWPLPPGARREGLAGRILAGAEPGWSVHLFLRAARQRDGRAAPFRYAGRLRFAGWQGAATAQLDLGAPLPEALRPLFGLT